MPTSNYTDATHLAIALWPRSDLTPARCKAVAEDILAAAREFQHATRGFVEIEPHAMGDLLEGKPIRALWGKVYADLNDGRHSNKPPAEPGIDEVAAYIERFPLTANGNVVVLLPRLKSDERMVAESIDPAANKFRAFVSQMPLARIEIQYVECGTLDSRHPPIRSYLPDSNEQNF
jgi:hypothetical protein